MSGDRKDSWQREEAWSRQAELARLEREEKQKDKYGYGRGVGITIDLAAILRKLFSWRKKE